MPRRCHRSFLCDTGGVARVVDASGMSVDYHQFINRNLPIRERACTSKAVFVSRGEAKALTRHGRRTDGVKPYRCRWCGGWHLGHARRRR
jgi:hypothetical protein